MNGSPWLRTRLSHCLHPYMCTLDVDRRAGYRTMVLVHFIHPHRSCVPMCRVQVCFVSSPLFLPLARPDDATGIAKQRLTGCSNNNSSNSNKKSLASSGCAFYEKARDYTTGRGLGLLEKGDKQVEVPRARGENASLLYLYGKHFSSLILSEAQLVVVFVLLDLGAIMMASSILLLLLLFLFLDCD